MSLTLASAWQPRGELDRFIRLLPVLGESYQYFIITLPPDADLARRDELFTRIGQVLNSGGPIPGERIQVVVTPEWAWGRYLTVQKALKTASSHIHYIDFDRLLRWVEKDAAEWRQAVEKIQKVDCLIMGRSQAAYDTHPQALRQTEKISNLVVSNLLGMEVDVSAGSKGFSRQAAAFIIANTRPGNPFGTDAEWPLLLQRAGFEVLYEATSGLDWESADRYLEKAADDNFQRQAAQTYDADPGHWEYRVQVAFDIVNAGLDAVSRPLK
jgi:hypothetical protein